MGARAIALDALEPPRGSTARLTPVVLVGGAGLALAASLAGSGPWGAPAAVLVAVLGLALGWHVRRLPLWCAVVGSTVAGFVLLGRGFGYVGVQLGPLPLLAGELTILFGLALMPHGRLLGRLLRDRITVWITLWMSYGGAILLLNARNLTFDVAKDASVVYYPVFFYFGYAAARSERTRENILRLLGWTFLVHAVYVFGFPWDATIQEVSPRVLFDLGLFGHYNTGYVHILGGALFFVMLGPRVFPGWPRGLAVSVGALYLGTLLFVQSRAGILGALTCVAVLVLLGYHGRFAKLGAGLAALVLLMAVAGSQGLTLQGWKAPVTFDFLVHMVQTIFGGGGLDYQAGLHATRASRFQMWQTAIEPNLQSPWLFLFGDGFSNLLIDIELTTGWIKRSPHNSYVTVFARLGAVGLALFAALHLRFLAVVLRALRRTRSVRQPDVRRRLSWYLVYYVAFTFGAMFSVVYDTPYMAAPAYFVMGLAYWTAREALAAGRGSIETTVRTNDREVASC